MPRVKAWFFLRLRRLDYLFSRTRNKQGTLASPAQTPAGVIGGMITIILLFGYLIVVVSTAFDGLRPDRIHLVPYLLQGISRSSFSWINGLDYKLQFETLIGDCPASLNGSAICAGGNSTAWADAHLLFLPPSNKTDSIHCDRVVSGGLPFCHLRWTTVRAHSAHGSLQAFTLNASVGTIGWARVSSFLIAASMTNDNEAAKNYLGNLSITSVGQYLFSAFDTCNENSYTTPANIELGGVLRRIHFEPESFLHGAGQLQDTVAQGVFFPELAYADGPNAYDRQNHRLAVRVTPEAQTWLMSGEDVAAKLAIQIIGYFGSLLAIIPHAKRLCFAVWNVLPSRRPQRRSLVALAAGGVVLAIAVGMFVSQRYTQGGILGSVLVLSMMCLSTLVVILAVWHLCIWARDGRPQRKGDMLDSPLLDEGDHSSNQGHPVAHQDPASRAETWESN
jgi:hypothetical protein